MNIFFGKISNKYDTNQITEGFYKAPKGSSWFGDIEIDDYTFLIGGNKIQLWKAREWGKHNNDECLWFDIINNDLQIKTNRLSALKFFKLTTDLIIHSSRTAKNRCFFKLDVIKDFNIEDLAKTSFYKNNELYRKIVIYKNQDLVEPNLEDLQFYFSENKLHLHPNSFTEEKVITSFKDNFKYVGKGSTNKDKTMSRILNSDNQATTFSYNQISMRSIYDTFFCKYEEKLKYYLVGAFWENWNPEDQTSIFLKNSIWENGYDDRFINEVNSVPNNSKIAIKTIDRKGDNMYIKAMGTVMKNHKNGKLLDVQWEEEFDEFKLDFSGGYWKTIHEVKNKDHINAIWENKESRTMENKESRTMENKAIIDEEKINNTPLNQILFGPPGTGKTYHIQKNLFHQYTSERNTITKEQHFDNVVSNCSWWQILAIALIDEGDSKISNLLNNKWVKKKASFGNSKNIRPTIWGQLQRHTVEECKYVNVSERSQPLIFNKKENSVWEIILDQVEELSPELLTIKASVDNFSPNHNEIIKRYDFVTFHQSFSYEDFIEGIKPVLPNTEDETIKLSYKIEDGVFKKLCLRAKHDPNNKYAIFIDEINRGNVSAIFGELITLIEKDKRSSNDNKIEITLPYSKEKFSVPSNIDIYGTMNTADRSVEALDTALRRRFEFKEMMPKYDLNELKTPLNINLGEALKKINQRIEALLDREHQIGHSYLLNIENEKQLLDAFQNKIIPLLQEYFYNDYEKIRLVIGDNFIRKENTKIEFAIKNNDYETNSIYTWKELNENNIIDNVTSIYSTQTFNE